MKGTAAVLWVLWGTFHPGSLEVHRDRLELRARRRAVAIPFDSVREFTIERGPASRINGLPVLRLQLATGDVVRLASLEGTGVLHELCGVLAPPASLNVAR
jgi:hypothetical protein